MEQTKAVAVEDTKEDKAPDPQPISDADNFFAIAAKDREADFKNFVKELGKPKEKMDDVELDFMEEDDDPELEGMSEQEKEMAGYFEVSDGHKEMARMALMVVDKFLAFLAGLYSGMDMNRYKRAQKPDDYEIEVTAAMMKKYEVEMSLEWMFAVALIGAYSPAFQKAYADRQANMAAREKQRRQDELEILASRIRQN